MYSKCFIVAIIWLIIMTYRSHVVWCLSCLTNNIDVKSHIIDNQNDSFVVNLCPDSKLSFMAISKTRSQVFVFTSLSRETSEAMKTADKVDVSLGSITGQFREKHFPDSLLLLVLKISPYIPISVTTAVTTTTTVNQESNETDKESTPVKNDMFTSEESTDTTISVTIETTVTFEESITTTLSDLQADSTPAGHELDYENSESSKARKSVKRLNRNQDNGATVKINGNVYKLNDNEEMHTTDLYAKNDIIKISSDGTGSLNRFRDSYIVFCFEKNSASYMKYRCETEITGKDLYCRCKNRGFIQSFTAIIVILILWLAMTLWVFWSKFTERPPGEPELQVALVMCSAKSFLYQYIIELKVGCPSSDYDLDKTTVDFELLDASRQSVANPVRFSSNKLPDPQSSIMRIVMGRLTPIPLIAYIRANHSQPSESELYLFSFTITEIPKNGKQRKLLQKSSINQYIKNHPKVFAAQIGNETLAETKTPEIATPALSWFDLQVFTSFCISLLAIFCMFVLQSKEALFQSLLSGLLSAGATLIMGSLLFYIYKYNLKKFEAEIKCQDIGTGIEKSEEAYNVFTLSRYIMLAVMLTVIIVLTLVMAFFGLKLSFIQSLFWLGSCLCAGAIVFGTWHVVAGVVRETLDTVRGHSGEDLELEPSSISMKSATGSSMSMKSDKPEPIFNKTISTPTATTVAPASAPKAQLPVKPLVSPKKPQQSTPTKAAVNVAKSPAKSVVKNSDQRLQSKVVDKQNKQK